MKRFITSFLIIGCMLITLGVNAQQNARNVVIEYTTSTQCGGCPCLDSVLQQVVLVRHSQTIVLAFHTPWSHFGGYHGQGITDSLNAGGGDPSACIDRTIYNVEGFPAFVDSVDSWYNNAPFSPVKIDVSSKNYNASTRMLTLEVAAESLADTLSGLYRISVVIVEGNIMFEQSAHPPCTGGPNYIHYDVVRNMVNDMYGDTLINGTWTKNLSVHKIFNTLIDQSWVDRNCDFIVYVYKQQPGPLRKVVNYHIQQGIRSSVTGALGIADRQENGSGNLKVYPNPASEVANIHLKIRKETFADLTVVNMEGKVVKQLFSRVFQEGEYNMELNAADLPGGIYSCLLHTSDGVEIQKLVIL